MKWKASWETISIISCHRSSCSSGTWQSSSFSISAEKASRKSWRACQRETPIGTCSRYRLWEANFQSQCLCIYAAKFPPAGKRRQCNSSVLKKYPLLKIHLKRSHGTLQENFVELRLDQLLGNGVKYVHMHDLLRQTKSSHMDAIVKNLAFS